MTEDEKLAEVVEFLETCAMDGGYPRDSRWIGDVLVVSSTPLEKPTGIDAYHCADLLAWYDAAVAYAAEEPNYCDEMEAAFFEVEWPRDIAEQPPAKPVSETAG